MSKSDYWERWNRVRLNRRGLIAGVGALSAGYAALVAVGCGGDDKKSSGAKTSGPTTAAGGPGASPSPAAGQPRVGGTLNHPNWGNPITFDPHTDASSSTMMSFLGLVYSKLLELDSDFNTKSDLAEKTEQPDPLTIVFTLQKNARWHNLAPLNGRQLTASDVKFSLERMATPNPQFLRSYQFEAVDSVEAVDATTVRIKLKQPFAPLLTFMGQEWAAIVAPEVVAKFGDLKKFESLIGTGPYVKESTQPDVVHIVKANPDYFVKGKPYIQEIHNLVVPDAATRAANVRSKKLDIDWWGGIPKDIVTDLQKDTPKLVFKQWPGTWYYIDRFNLKRVSAFKDTRVRQALHLAANRQASINGVFGGDGQLNGPVPWGFTKYALTQNELLKMPGYRQQKDDDLKQAKQLLEAAGQNGLKFKLLSTTGNKEAEIRQADFNRIGVQTEIEAVDTAGILSRLPQGNFEFSAWLDNAFWDPDDYLYGNTHTKGSRNYQGFSNPDIDKMIEDQRKELDATKRIKIVKDVQQKIIDEAPYLSVGSINGWWAWWPYLKGRELSGALNPYQYKDCWLDSADSTWRG